MSLSRVYTSKIYLTSSRKDRIHAAIQDPINVELVQQVSDFLDDDAKVELKRAIAERESAAEADSLAQSKSDEGNVFDNIDTGSLGGGSHHSSGGGSSNLFDDIGDMGDDLGEGDLGEGEPADISDIPEGGDAGSDVDIEESTEVIADDGIEVNATEEQPVIQSGIIKKLLNAQDDTKGVVRVDPTEDEVWIYYEDKVNLNDVMDNVITVIKDTYSTLKFSRLARTDNAIVFDIKE